MKKKKAVPLVVFAEDPSHLGKMTKTQWVRAKKAKVPWVVLSQPKGLAVAAKRLKTCHGVVDALFGIGLTRPVEGPYLEAVRCINRAGKKVLSLDVPSGLSSDTGRVMGEAVKATRTITFALPKPCFFTPRGAELSGPWSVADLGLPSSCLEDPRIERELIDGRMVASSLPVYGASTHKGTRGRLLIVAGATGLTGAAALCAWGAQRIGAGLVTVACPESLNPILEIKLTEPMTDPLPEVEGGFLSSRALGRILSLASKANALVIGPGIGRHHETARLVRELILQTRVPTLVDADALALCGADKDLFRAAKAPLVVTPHPGEAAIMLKTSISDVESRRSIVAEQIAREYNVIAVLKGPWTLVAHPQKGLRVNPTGTRALGTAGTGDVLSGVVGGLLAQRMPPWEAASAGVYLHGLAGKKVEERLGPDGVLAGDLLPMLPQVLRETRGSVDLRKVVVPKNILSPG
jgi:hydroxyethylthiazole kinase-like uncharacterized protein yjeF